MAAEHGYDWVWRCDDDAIPEPRVLETLYKHIGDDVGAIGGAILTPPNLFENCSSTGKIDNIDSEPNIQWSPINRIKEVEHLHCSFLYRAGVFDFNTGLSRVAHREETLFTHGLFQKGYKVLTVPGATTWHMKNPQGGIRSETKREMFEHDEHSFRSLLELRGKTIVVLNNGLGDHIVFKRILPLIKNAEVFSCYPDIVPGRSIAEAHHLLGDLGPYNIYQKMDQWRWKDSLEKAFRKLYL
jgi:hypothetical protein